MTALLRQVGDTAPATAAVGSWNLVDVAVHLSHAWAALPSKSRGDSTAFADLGSGRARAAGDLGPRGDDVDGRQGATRERDLRAIADKIDRCAADYFAACAGQIVDETHPWMVEGVDVPQSVFTAHLLNETVVHGYDIARAAGQPWVVNPVHAALVVEGFIVRILQTFPPETFVTKRAAGHRATFELRVRGGGSYHFRFRDGAVHVGPPEGPVDCYLSADAAAFLLVVFTRQSQWEAHLARQAPRLGSQALARGAVQVFPASNLTVCHICRFTYTTR